MYFSVIVVLDVSADKFELIELSDNDTEFPIDIQWVDNTSIIGTSYAIPPWRLGLYACNNRPSRIFQVGADGKNLSKEFENVHQCLNLIGNIVIRRVFKR